MKMNLLKKYIYKNQTPLSRGSDPVEEVVPGSPWVLAAGSHHGLASGKRQ